MLTAIFRSRPCRWNGRTSIFLAGFIVFGAGLFASVVGGPSAWAEGAASTQVSQTLVDELTERVKILELENEALERRVRLDAAHNALTIKDLERRLRALEARAEKAPASSTAEPPAQPDPSAQPEVSCKDRYIDLGRGIRRIKAGCESTGNLCDAPEVVDERGIRTVLPACRQSVEDDTSGCASPYFIDTQGLKRFKAQCL